MGRVFLRPVLSPVPTAVVVTGYVEIPGHPRTRDEYLALGIQLAEAHVPLMFMEDRLDECWLYKYIDESGKTFTHSVADNPKKNTLAYHIVQAQKSEWLVRALDVLPTFGLPNVMVWVDFGIFSVPGIDKEIVTDFVRRVASEELITIPGVWNSEYQYDDQNPCWRFCGGVLVMPRKHAVKFDQEMKHEYKRWMELTGNVSWEVNTMARLENIKPWLPIRHYYADHDNSLFVNY